MQGFIGFTVQLFCLINIFVSNHNKKANKWHLGLLRNRTLPNIGVRTEVNWKQQKRDFKKFWNWLFGENAKAVFEVFLTAQGLLLVSNTKSVARLKVIRYATPVDPAYAQYFSNAVSLPKDGMDLFGDP